MLVRVYIYIYIYIGKYIMFILYHFIWYVDELSIKFVPTNS